LPGIAAAGLMRVMPAAATVVLQCSHETMVTATQFGPDFGPSQLVAVRADSLDVGLG
jgi:hypothetical protein